MNNTNSHQPKGHCCSDKNCKCNTVSNDWKLAIILLLFVLFVFILHSK